MKSLLFVVLLVLATAFAQRPFYAGSRPIGTPDLASRFKPDGGTTQQGTFPKPFDPNAYYNYPPRGVPIDAHGDIDLVNRISTWPRQNQPFWFINAGQIEAHRNTYRSYPYAYTYPYVYNYPIRQIESSDIGEIVLLDDVLETGP